MKRFRQVSAATSNKHWTSDWIVSACAALAAASLVAPASAQSVREPLDAAFSRWTAEHGPNWRIDLDEGTGAAEYLYGGSVRPAFVPSDDEQWFALARLALGEAFDLHRIEPSTLVADRALFLPLGMIGTSDKMTVRFRQSV